MLDTIAICAASAFFSMTVAAPASASPVYVSLATMGECPPYVALQLTAIAEKDCKRQGKDYVITYMNCTGDGSGGNADFAYTCI